MRKNNINLIWFIYTIIFVLQVFFPIHSFKLMLTIMILNIVLTLIDKRLRLITLFSSFIMSNEIISLLNFLAILLISTKFTRNKNEKITFKQLLLLLIIIGNSLISATINNTYINVIFSLIYLSLLLFFISKLDLCSFDDFVLKLVIKKVIILEFLIFLCLLFKYKTFAPSDINYGTLMNAHLFGNLLIILILYLIGNKNILLNIKSNLLYILLCLIMLYCADSKTLLVTVLLLILILPVLNLKQELNKKVIFKYIISLYLVLYFVLPIIKLNFMKNFIYNNFGYIYNYIYDANFNYKFQYFNGTLSDELKGYRMLFGFGLGQYGSRFANLFTYDVSYRTDNALNTFVKNNFKPHYNVHYIKYIAFYDTNFVNAIRWRSAILSYPYNSIIAIIGEIGWLGLIFFALFVDEKYKKSMYKSILYYFLLACFFDNYFDMFSVIGLILFFLSIKTENQCDE